MRGLCAVLLAACLLTGCAPRVLITPKGVDADVTVRATPNVDVRVGTKGVGAAVRAGPAIVVLAPRVWRIWR